MNTAHGSRLRQGHQGFGTLEVLLVLLVAIVLAGAGWYIWQRQHKSTSSNSTNSQTGSNTTPTPKPTPDAYAGWKTYTSRTGNFALRYPSTWDISGFQGDTPTSPDPATGEMSGAETIIRLVHDDDASNQFGMDLNLTSAPPAFYGNYSDGTVTVLTNGLSLWIHKKQDPAVAGRAGACPVMQLVSGQEFAAKLANGTTLTLSGSFCWNQKSNPTYTYDQQVNSVSFRQAEQILESIQAQ